MPHRSCQGWLRRASVQTCFPSIRIPLHAGILASEQARDRLLTGLNPRQGELLSPRALVATAGTTTTRLSPRLKGPAGGRPFSQPSFRGDQSCTHHRRLAAHRITASAFPSASFRQRIAVDAARWSRFGHGGFVCPFLFFAGTGDPRNQR